VLVKEDQVVVVVVVKVVVKPVHMEEVGEVV
jgi:hypothetical protein